jgi:hypothetical protein
MNLQGLKRTIARVEIDEKPNGTAFLVGRKHVVTALHVLAGRRQVQLVFPEWPKIDPPLVGTLSWRHPAGYDVAVLDLQRACPDDVEPLPWASAAPIDGDSWSSWGFPSQVPNGYTTSDQVRDPSLLIAEWDLRVLQLETPAATYDLGGMSGAPCVIGGAIVGVISHQLRRTLSDGAEEVWAPSLNTLYGLPIELLGTAPIVAPIAAPALGWERVANLYAAAVIQKLCGVSFQGLSTDGAAAKALPPESAFQSFRLQATGNSQAMLSIGDLQGRPTTVLVGPRGSGKSVVLKILLARAVAQRRAVPLLIPLGRLATTQGPITEGTLVEFLFRQASEELGLEEADHRFFRTILANGRAVLALDGLDEVGSRAQREDIVALIQTLGANGAGNRTILASRPEAYDQTPVPGADRGREEAYELCPFDEDDIRTFLATCFGDDGSAADAIIASPGLRHIRDRPLALSLFAIRLRTDGKLPTTDLDLTEAYVATALVTWEERRGPDPGAPTVEERWAICEELAWEVHRAAASSRRLLELQALKATEGGLLRLRSTRPAMAALMWIVTRSGLFEVGAEAERPRSRPVYSSAHMQVQEYLAGRALASRWELTAAAALRTTGAELFSPFWTEARRFAVAWLSKRSDLHNLMVREVLDHDDPYEDLLHANLFNAAGLLAACDVADAELVREVAEALHVVQGSESEWAREAFAALLTLAGHEGAQPLLLGMASGEGATLNQRLDAIAALSPFLPRSQRLVLLERVWVDAAEDLSSLVKVVECWAMCDAETACPKLLATVEQVLTAHAWWVVARQLVQVAKTLGVMPQVSERLGEAARKSEFPEGQLRLLAWLVEAGDRDAEPSLIRQALGALSQFDDYIIDPVEEAIALARARMAAGLESPEARTLIDRAIEHPAIGWQLVPLLARLRGEFGARGIARMIAEVSGDWDTSRLNSTVSSVIQERDDGVAVPALMALLRAKRTRLWNGPAIVASLVARGKAEEAAELLSAIAVDGTQDIVARFTAAQCLGPLDEAKAEAAWAVVLSRMDPERAAAAIIHDLSTSGGKPGGGAARAAFTAIARREGGPEALLAARRGVEPGSFLDRSVRAVLLEVLPLEAALAVSGDWSDGPTEELALRLVMAKHPALPTLVARMPPDDRPSFRLRAAEALSSEGRRDEALAWAQAVADGGDVPCLQRCRAAEILRDLGAPLPLARRKALIREAFVGDRVAGVRSAFALVDRKAGSEIAAELLADSLGAADVSPSDAVGLLSSLPGETLRDWLPFLPRLAELARSLGQDDPVRGKLVRFIRVATM